MPDVIGDWQALDGLSDMDSINTGKITFWINIRTVQFKVVHLKFSEIKRILWIGSLQRFFDFSNGEITIIPKNTVNQNTVK